MTDPTPEEVVRPGSAEFWEAQYASRDRVWSGTVNAALVDMVADFTPGRSLDVGCGEGADVIWLASQGWDATGIDLSPIAIGRAQTAAREHGVSPQFEAADVTSWVPPHEQGYDLVTGSFLHTREPGTRGPLLGALGARVSIGGRLLLISHAAMPPWATREHECGHTHRHEAVTPDGDEALLRDSAIGNWVREVGEIRTRQASGPGGELATLQDAVLLVRRTG